MPVEYPPPLMHREPLPLQSDPPLLQGSNFMNALFYPFHLCHERTLTCLLTDYQIVYFRDFMALQLTPMMGTTAFPDRMGDYHHEHLKSGRILQGFDVSGSLNPETVSAVNRDLADSQWRHLFQESLLNDRRFQRGLFADPKEGITKHSQAPLKPEWLKFREKEWGNTSFDVETIQALSRRRLHGEDATRFEYGWAMIKTSASLIYTIQLCHQLNLVAVTDSSAHYHLLARISDRDRVALENIHVKREGY